MDLDYIHVARLEHDVRVSIANYGVVRLLQRASGDSCPFHPQGLAEDVSAKRRYKTKFLHVDSAVLRPT